ncbi:hypothetical protein D8674_014315 [Pyrus ussuriensis x Pyrus communis]|uniref:Uncharacterized protein n=1 Tax=Pyrus ussuriensis x Pyrus communis TaxID=2448454 RepID=A0A5N5GS83_9ROSA|nr:hypothetical protein D8674_014315 [Pyrus ussuriensis x Pyrus communis]
MEAQPRRRKADEPSSFSGIKVPAPVEKKSRVGTSLPESQTTSAGVNLRIVQAKNAAVAQAQKGATGSYREQVVSKCRIGPRFGIPSIDGTEMEPPDEGQGPNRGGHPVTNFGRT